MPPLPDDGATSAVSPAPTQDAPPEQSPAESNEIVIDATGSYERFDLDWSDEESTPDEGGTPREQTSEQAPEGEAAETANRQEAPEPPAQSQEEGQPETRTTPEVDDEALDRLLRDDPRVQRRLDNLVGNRLQEAREQQRRWEADDQLYQRLQSDANFRNQQIQQYGFDAVAKWTAEYTQERAARPANPADPQVQGALQQVANDFNERALGIFREVAQGIEGYDNLPADARKKLDELSLEAPNWFQEGLQSLIEGTTASLKNEIAQLRKEIDTAREAGRAEARSSREQSGPVVIDRTDGQPMSFEEVERRFASGDPSITLEQFEKARIAAGREF